MTQLLKEAFAAASKLSAQEQDNLARLILEQIEQKTEQKTTKKPSPLKPITKGSGYTDTSINHDTILAEMTLSQKLPQENL